MTGISDRISDYGLSMNKMFDYMASGKPTVSNIKTNFDILEINQCGVSVEPGDAEKLANAVYEFYKMSDTQYREYCTHAKEAVKKYDFKYLTNELEKIIYSDVSGVR